MGVLAPLSSTIPIDPVGVQVPFVPPASVPPLPADGSNLPTLPHAQVLRRDIFAVMPAHASVSGPLPSPRLLEFRIRLPPDPPFQLRPNLPSLPQSPWASCQLHIAVVAQLMSVKPQSPDRPYIDWNGVAVEYIRLRPPNISIHPSAFLWPDCWNLFIIPADEVSDFISLATLDSISATVIVPDPVAVTANQLTNLAQVVMSLPGSSSCFSDLHPDDVPPFDHALAFIIDSFTFQPSSPPVFVTAQVHPRWSELVPEPYCTLANRRALLLQLLRHYPEDNDVFALLDGIDFGVAVNYEGDRLSPSWARPSRKFFAHDVTPILAKERNKGWLTKDFTNDTPLFALPLFNLKMSTVYGAKKSISNKIRLIQNLSHKEKRLPTPLLSPSTPRPLLEVTANLPSPAQVPPRSVNEDTLRLCEDKWTTFNTAKQVLAVMGKNTIMFSFDLVAAYKIPKLHPQDYHLTGFVLPESQEQPNVIGSVGFATKIALGGTTSYDNYQPFGKVAEFIGRETLHKVAPNGALLRFVDDFWGAIPPLLNGSPDWVRGRVAFRRLQECFDSLEWEVGKWKAPTLTIKWLGHFFDSQKLAAILTEPRRLFMVEELKRWQTQKTASLHDAQSWYGKLRFASEVVPQGKVFCACWITFMRICAKLTRKSGNPYARPQLTTAIREGTEWWLTTLTHPKFKGVYLLRTAEFAVAAQMGHVISPKTDACLLGGGFLCNRDWSSRKFPPWVLKLAMRIKTKSITFLEGYTIVDCVATFGRLWKGRKVIIQTDSEAFCNIFNKGHTGDPYLQCLLTTLTHLQAIFDFDLALEHIKGTENHDADLLSRLFVDRFLLKNPWANRKPTAILGWPIQPSWPK